MREPEAQVQRTEVSVDQAREMILREVSPIGPHTVDLRGAQGRVLVEEIRADRLVPPLQVLQPDACWVGGMTEMVKIYRMAEEAGLRVVPHRGCEVWGLHALAALDSRPLAWEEGL